MLISDERDSDVFFDSLDCLSPPQECVLTKQKFGYEIWVNEPLSVSERREKFLQGMSLVDDSSKVCLQEKMVSFDESSVSLGKERIWNCNGAVTNASIVLDDHVPEKSVTAGCESSFEAQVLFDELKGCHDHEDKSEPDLSFQGKVHELSSSNQECRDREGEAVEKFKDFEICKNKKKCWWARIVNSIKGGEGKNRSKLKTRTSESRRIHVRQNKKKWMELSALYIGQEIRAHNGLIWTIKFSPSGKYLASGGEDGVVRVWRVVSLDTSSDYFITDDSIISKVKHDISCSQRKNSSQSLNALPNKILQIEESPLQEFYGHSGDVLDVAWSSSDVLLSSSTDKTVRLWQIGYNECQSVFHHKDYVTCIQFNPVDENYFISGSTDGKVRIWGVLEERVVDWADIRDAVSAISYQPDGKGFVVGTLTGTCRFFIASGLPKSGSQMSGSFTSTEKHLISVGDDSHIYVWNFNELRNASSKHTKSEYSCEYFSSKGVTVAIPWSDMSASSHNKSPGYSSEVHTSTVPRARESKRFSFRSGFLIDGTCQGSMTWPEEKLVSLDLPFPEDEFDHQQLCLKNIFHNNSVSEIWGLSIVAADCDGIIKTFHNFGLPVRL
ncbi:hypothetical protein Lal_00004436 [Lupinus albus]|nr:hypothetical protein Lal_00004436 [Lupinus albus]